MKFPGVFWVALLALIPHIIEWLGGDYFAGQRWVAVVVVVLGALAKLIELLQGVYVGPRVRSVVGEEEGGFSLVSFLFG